MGERYVIDGEAMQRTCYPDVPDRVLPCALDVAATVLDSSAEYEELSNQMQLYPGLREQIDNIKGELARIQPDKWQRSTYNYWLYALRALSAGYSGEVCDFMKTSLWNRAKLNTQLASWTELRHDNILYAKQTFAPSPWNEGLGLVESYPGFYERLEGICNQLASVIDSSGISLNFHRNRLQQLAGWAFQFGGYALKTANGNPLSTDEQSEIKRWGLHLLDFFASGEMWEEDPELIADVASSSITHEVLHEAVGKINPIIIIYTEPDTKRVLAGVGYVMSYYKLIETNWNRLNDDEWKRMLEEKPPTRPGWTSGYIAM